MIRCLKDSLSFAPAGIQTRLAQCTERFIAETLPRLLVPDLSTALEKLLSDRFRRLSSAAKDAARRAVAQADAGRLEARFRQLVGHRVQRYRPELRITFQRTLRLPDDGKTYPLPPGLGEFPLRLVQEFAHRVPVEWRPRGGVLMPMYQAEALWLEFSGTRYPFAVKIGTGKVNAISGQPWAPELSREPQGYVVVPDQPWLDGYCAGPGVVRQFVATRLGAGYTAEEQLDGTTCGGLQFEVFPINPEVFFSKQLQAELPRSVQDVLASFIRELAGVDDAPRFSLKDATDGRLGLGAGGAMKQEIYADLWEPDDWDLSCPARAWVHLCDAQRWRAITGESPPQPPITAEEYAKHGLPWFDYYRDDQTALEGSPILARIQSVFKLAKKAEDESIPQEGTVVPGPVMPIGPDAPRDRVLEWDGN